MRRTRTTGGRGEGKKRMIAYNEQYRGSKFASMRKHADLP